MPIELRRDSLMPEVVSLSITAYFFVLTSLAIFKSGIDHARSILMIDVVCVVFWCVALTARAIRRGQLPAKGSKSNIVSGVLILLIVLYLGNVFWNTGYLNLFAVDTLFSGQSHIDTMFHTSISEAIKNYHVPSILLNHTRYLPYHFGSHALIGVIASALNLPAFIVYNYLYPILFGPIFFCVVICLILEVKKINKVKPVISPFDLLILFVGLVGIFPASILMKMGIYYSSIFVSESFLLGMIALIAFLLLAARSLNNGRFQSKAYVAVFAGIIVPVFILICSVCKVSIGFLLFVGCAYYVFRKLDWKRAKYPLVFLYTLVFVACYRAFSESGDATFRPFDFVRQYVDGTAWIWYFFNAYLFAFIFIYASVREKRDLIAALKGNELIDQEVLLVVSIAGALPGLLLSIAGGGADYFSMVQGIVVLPFLIGSERLKPSRSLPARIAYFILAVNLLFSTNSFLFIKNVGIERIGRSELPLGKGRRNAFVEKLKKGKIVDAFTMVSDLYFSPIQTSKYITFKSQLDYVNELTKDSKRESAVFVAPECQLWNVQQNGKSSPFFVPCYTGLVVINAVYSDGTTLYDGGGGTVGDVRTVLGYGLDTLKTEPQKDLSRSIEVAKKQGFKRLIVLDKDVRVVELSGGF